MMSMTVVTAPDSIAGYAQDVMSPNFVPTIFLAGAIDMGAAVDWQAYVIDKLQDKRCILFNPRRATAFTPAMLDEQIEWELDAMTHADAILMWFPKDSKAPVAMFETGLFLESGKLYLGVEPGFYRARNLELTSQYFSRRIFGSLDELLDMLIDEWEI